MTPRPLIESTTRGLNSGVAHLCLKIQVSHPDPDLSSPISSLPGGRSFDGRPHLQRLTDHSKNGLVIAQGCNIPDTAAEFNFVS
jgi:hypothetical protein